VERDAIQARMRREGLAVEVFCAQIPVRD